MRAPTSGTSTPEYGRNPLTGEPLEAEGQFTAIVTGIVSVALAIGYLGLANALDSRDIAAAAESAMGDGSARPRMRFARGDSREDSDAIMMIAIFFFTFTSR